MGTFSFSPRTTSTSLIFESYHFLYTGPVLKGAGPFLFLPCELLGLGEGCRVVDVKELPLVLWWDLVESDAGELGKGLEGAAVLMEHGMEVREECGRVNREGGFRMCADGNGCQGVWEVGGKKSRVEFGWLSAEGRRR